MPGRFDILKCEASFYDITHSGVAVKRALETHYRREKKREHKIQIRTFFPSVETVKRH